MSHKTRGMGGATGVKEPIGKYYFMTDSFFSVFVFSVFLSFYVSLFVSVCVCSEICYVYIGNKIGQHTSVSKNTKCLFIKSLKS